jgi:putative intracellular protease/amidase
MATQKRVLFILTNSNQLTPDVPTGVWAEEYAVPLRMLRDQQAQVTLASPQGGTVPIDENSLKDFDVEAYANELAELKTTLPLDQVDESSYDAVFFPGGHGPVVDLPDNAKVQTIIRSFNAQQKPIGAVCHGLAALMKATDDQGKPVVEGRQVTGFANAEEDAVGLSKAMPYLIEERLRQLGAKYVKADQPFASKAVVDGHIVTGQNPASSADTARKFIEALKL